MIIAIIKGDIIGSRNLKNQEVWMQPLKAMLASWGISPKDWELVWGDFFQVEITRPEEVLEKIFLIKAAIRKLEPMDKGKKINVRLAVGLGEKDFSGERISESNGPAFIYAGEKFELLKKESVTMGLKSSKPNFDEEFNLYLKLAGVFMDSWSVSSAALAEIVLNNRQITQEEIGRILGIKQSGVSGRWKRAHIDEVLSIEKMFRKKFTTFFK